VEDGITGQAQLAQHFPRDAHDFGQALRPDYDERDGENQKYFKRVQASMTVRSVRDSVKLTSFGARKFHAPSPFQLIIIKVWSVNDA
jgi:hypothetical protein